MLRTAAAIVHYGRYEPTLACLQALGHSEWPVQAWVVDNGGPEAGRGDLRRQVGERWIDPGENLGYGRALNRVATQALESDGYDLLLCLNNDALVTPQAIGQLVRALEADPGRAIAVPRILRQEDPERLWYGGGEIDWLRGSARVDGGDPESAEARRARDVGFATGCVMLVRLEAMAVAGGFDQRYFLYEEDVELSIRLRAAGWSLRYVPEAVVRHAGQGSQRTDGEPFVPIDRADNPRAAMLTELRVCNRLLTVSQHAGFFRSSVFAACFAAEWTIRSLTAIAGGHPEIPAAVGRGMARFGRLRRLHPSTELVENEGHRSAEAPWSPR